MEGISGDFHLYTDYYISIGGPSVMALKSGVLCAYGGNHSVLQEWTNLQSGGLWVIARPS